MSLTQADQVYHEHAVLQRHECKVNTLHQRPDSQVGLVDGNEGVAPFLDWITALHDGHGRHKAGNLGRGKEALVCSHSSGDGTLVAVQHDMALEEAEPCCGGRSEYC